VISPGFGLYVRTSLTFVSFGDLVRVGQRGTTDRSEYLRASPAVKTADSPQAVNRLLTEGRA
jgi:hypothetical protein